VFTVFIPYSAPVIAFSVTLFVVLFARVGAVGAPCAARCIVIVNSRVASGDVPLLALTVNVYAPIAAALGVPVIAPCSEIVKPPGNAPAAMLHVTGVVLVADSVWLYTVPNVPFGNVVVVIVGGVAGAATFIVQVAVSVPFVTVITAVPNTFLVLTEPVVAFTVATFVFDDENVSVSVSNPGEMFNGIKNVWFLSDSI